MDDGDDLGIWRHVRWGNVIYVPTGIMSSFWEELRCCVEVTLSLSLPSIGSYTPIYCSSVALDIMRKSQGWILHMLNKVMCMFYRFVYVFVMKGCFGR